MRYPQSVQRGVDCDESTTDYRKHLNRRFLKSKFEGDVLHRVGL